MSPLSARDARDLGHGLHAAGFHPLPDVADDGTLIGTRLWRVHAGYVECLTLRPNGLAHATRAEATFGYQHPTDHGPVVDHYSGHALNALHWLLTSADGLSSDLPRPYTTLHASHQHHEPGRRP